MAAIFAQSALLPETGWVRDVRLVIGEDGRIASVSSGASAEPGDETLQNSILLPAPANLHSHAFQRAMAGMTEFRGPSDSDSFWTWRTLMYKFLDRLDPDQIEAIAALTYVEMLEAGYACVGEFHYLHHQPGGESYADPSELSTRIASAAAATGIGLTLLPVLYVYGGADKRPLAGGQLRFGCDFDRFVKLFEGATSTVAQLPEDAAIGIAQKCEALFFIAHMLERSGKTDLAKASYQQAIDTKQEQLSAYRGAKQALKRLAPADKTAVKPSETTN